MFVFSRWHHFSYRVCLLKTVTGVQHKPTVVIGHAESVPCFRICVRLAIFKGLLKLCGTHDCSFSRTVLARIFATCSRTVSGIRTALTSGGGLNGLWPGA